MIMVSQDKKNILNFNNISNLTLNETKGQGEYSAIVCFTNDGRKIILASYYSIQRGKEVFEQIIDFLSTAKEHNSIFVFEKE